MTRPGHWRLAARFAAHRWRELHPFEVQAQILNACELRCTYCLCPEKKIDLLSTEQWLAIIGQLAATGMMRIKFQGGEPTLRKDFRALTAASRRLGVITAVITNGQNVSADPSLLDDLDEVVFSLDSVTPELNDRLRGAGTHARVVQAIDIARARSLKVFVNMVVSRDTLAEVEPMLEFCERRAIGMNAQPVVFGRQYYNGAARGLALADGEVRDLHRRLAAWKRQRRPLMFSAVSYENVSSWPDYQELTTRSLGPSGCAAGRFYLHIEGNGDVHPCAQHGAGDWRPKNIVRDGFEEALRNAKLHDCADCFTAYLNERKAIFGLRPRAVLEMLRR